MALAVTPIAASEAWSGGASLATGTVNTRLKEIQDYLNAAVNLSAATVEILGNLRMGNGKTIGWLADPGLGPSIYGDTASLIIRNATSAIQINNQASSAELLRLTNAGNLALGTAIVPSGGGVPVFVLGQASGNPTGLGSNTAGLFAKDVAGTCELFAVDEAGNVAQLSPHTPEMYVPDPGYVYPWSYKAQNEFLGLEIEVDMEGLVRAIEALSGKQLLYQRTFTPAMSWDTHQTALVARRDVEIDAWLDLPAPERAKRPRPIAYTPKPMPAWMTSRLPK